jgi:membrane protein YqaA with SNARE-associated domain
MLIRRLNKDLNWLLHLFIYTCGTCAGGMPNWQLLKDTNIKKTQTL